MGKQFKCIRQTIDAQNEKHNREKTKMSEIEILELKNAITELKNSMESFGSRLDKQKREAVSLKII